MTDEEADKVKKIIFCTGKVYYDLIKERAKKELDSKIVIARVEQVIITHTSSTSSTMMPVTLSFWFAVVSIPI